jgi:hypothetical protein
VLKKEYMRVMHASTTFWTGELPTSAPAKTSARMVFTICAGMSFGAVDSPEAHSG